MIHKTEFNLYIYKDFCYPNCVKGQKKTITNYSFVYNELALIVLDVDVPWSLLKMAIPRGYVVEIS